MHWGTISGAATFIRKLYTTFNNVTVTICLLVSCNFVRDRLWFIIQKKVHLSTQRVVVPQTQHSLQQPGLRTLGSTIFFSSHYQLQIFHVLPGILFYIDASYISYFLHLVFKLFKIYLYSYDLVYGTAVSV